MLKSGRVIVVGGSIGGLATALALRRRGIETAVYERAATARDVGGGLIIRVNGMRALADLGLAEAVRARGAEVTLEEFRSWRGNKLLIRVPVTELARATGALPPVVLSRGDLLTVLREAVGDGAVRWGAELKGFEQDAEGVTARLADGSQERGALLVAADGIDSALRASMVGNVKPRYAGYQYLRAITEFEHPAYPPGAFVHTYGRGDRFGVQDVGGGRRYWFAAVATPQGSTDRPGGRKRELLERYGDFPVATASIIEATPEAGIFRADIRDIEPLARWGQGRVTLLGDAAHAMTPAMGRGAGETIEDAVALAEELGSPETLCDGAAASAALRRFEERRRPVTARIQGLSWRSGRLGALANPLACAGRDLLMRHVVSRALARSMRADYESAGAGGVEPR